MKKNRSFLAIIIMLVLATILTGVAMAEDGLLFRRNISKTPDAETEKSIIFMMDFYVPAQASTGLVGPVDNYLLADGVTPAYEAREFAKPLVTVYIDDIGHIPESTDHSSIEGGITFGHFDAFVGVSLDDGTTWKTTNLSRSQDKSSFNLRTGQAYPGDVHNVVHQVFGDNIFVAWASKYCEGGTPLYSLDASDLADYFTDLETTYSKDAIYLYDLFGVAGNQGSVDYTEQGFPEIGEIPYSCVWTTRGKLLAGDDPSTTDTVEASYVLWTKPERLTSGTRDVNLPVVDCAAGAGCILTWQEDPEGLRPGQGLGPGEGWSGAVAWQQTDIWYTHISLADFDKVFAAEDTVGAISMAEYALIPDATMPKPYVPMAMPVRLTDNAMCKAENESDPYCYIDFDTLDDIDHTNVEDWLANLTTPEADADYCMSSLPWTNPGGVEIPLCVTEDGRLLNGRVAATRVRMNLKPYTLADGTKSAWVALAAEESKALGDTADCDPNDPDCEDEPVDIGKDIWYYSFDPLKTGAEKTMLQQGGLLNQPAVCKDDTEEFCTAGLGEFYDLQTDELTGFQYYLTEISRRFALTTNSVSAATTSDSNLSAMLIYKQGIINQGGPADIMLRRVVFEVEDYTTNDFTAENICTGVVDLDLGEDDPAIPNISGSLLDIEGVPVPCTSITLTPTEITTVTVFTDASGQYSFTDVHSGTYTMTVTDEKAMLVGYDPLIPVEQEVVVDNVDLLVDVSLAFPRFACTGILDAQGDDEDNLALSDIGGTVGAPCISVQLESSTVLTTVYTSDAGDYLFQDFGIGIYTVTVTDEKGLLVATPDPILDVEVAAENPYAFENLDCDEWAFDDGSNPFYLQGVCLSPAINITSNTVIRCDAGSDNDTCAAAFPIEDDGSNPSGVEVPKVYEWRQCDGTTAIDGCEDDYDLDDQSWENPYDVAKGHRGFLDGDIVMIMYAWAPNWNSNTVGNDHYNLYARRSFDGGLTWTTTPADLGGVGVTYTEYYYGETIGDPVPVEWTYAAGAYEQGRNVSLLTGNQITILDPRYSPTGGLKLYPTIRLDWLTANGFSTEGLPYTDDLARDPSKYYIIYETGDNTTVEFGEATPLDLYYSRATVYGDVYETMDYVTDKDDELLDRWPWLENKKDDLSGEASIVVNPGGTFAYNVWNQWKEEITYDEYGEEHVRIYEADMIFRRLLYLPDGSEIQSRPVSLVLYRSHSAALYKNNTELTFIGTARDVDKLGDTEIVAYEWASSKDGFLGDAQELNILVSHLSLGSHIITFRAQDSEGNWSSPSIVSLLVGDQYFATGIPIVVK